MIAVGQKLPNATLYEFLDEETEGCAIGPNAFEIDKLVAGKKIVIFALPALSHQPALHNTCQVMLPSSMPSKPRALMKFGASQ